MKDQPHSRNPNRPSVSVLHSYEEKQTVLARWVKRSMEQGAKFWTAIALVLAVILIGVVFANLYMTGESSSSKAWLALLNAQTPDQQIKVAEDFPDSPAALWAKLQGASSLYNEGFALLPTKHDEASPLLKKAYTAYSEVYEKAAKSQPDAARLAAFGMARTLEASGDLGRAAEQYKKVAADWPGTDEAKKAAELAAALEKPRNAEFYKWLAAYKPTEVSLPPMGTGIIDEPPLPLGSTGKAEVPAAPGGVRAGTIPGPEVPLPSDVFAAPAESKATKKSGTRSATPPPAPSPSAPASKTGAPPK